MVWRCFFDAVHLGGAVMPRAGAGGLWRPGVRLTNVDKNLAKRIQQLLSCSSNDVFVRFFEALQGKSDEEVKSFFNRTASGGNTLSRIWLSLQQLAWSENAFRWVGDNPSWAIQEYQKLKKSCEPNSGVYNYANYRLGYCWLAQARQLRMELLKLLRYMLKHSFQNVKFDKWKALVQSCLRSLEISLAHSKLSTNQSHPVVEYNLACAYSVKATVIYENSLVSVRDYVKLYESIEIWDEIESVDSSFPVREFDDRYSKMPETDKFRPYKESVLRSLELSFERLQNSVTSTADYMNSAFLSSFAHETLTYCY